MTSAAEYMHSSMATLARECEICQQQRVAASTLRLPCCFQQVICVWCIAHSAEVQHRITCQHCGESITSPFSPADSVPPAAISRLPSGNMKKTVNVEHHERSESKSPLFKSSLLLDGIGVINEMDEDGRGQRCQNLQCPYNSVKTPCFHCGAWLCEMHELSHTNELSDKMLTDLETLHKRTNLWLSKSIRVLPKLARLTETFERTFENVISSWVVATMKAFANDIDRKANVLSAEAKQLKHDITDVIAETYKKIEVVKFVSLKAQDISSSLSVRGHNLTDICIYSNEISKLKVTICEVEKMTVPAPRFLPAVMSKPGAAWIREDRNISEWTSYFDSEENVVLQKIGAQKQAAIATAAKYGNIDRVTLLVDRADDYEEKSALVNAGLFSASRHGQIELVEYLLAKGASIHAQDNRGCSALVNAASGGNSNVVRLLLLKGANVRDATQQGYTTLIVAAQNGHDEMVKLLLDAGADVHAKTSYGDSALIFAAYWGHLSTVELLVESGANLNESNHNGDTALIAAAGNGHTAVVKNLIDAGADVSIANKNGCTALSAASKEEIRILLYAKGARAQSKAVVPSKQHSALTGLGFFRKIFA